MRLKTGSITRAEAVIIKARAASTPVEEIARGLNRSVRLVTSWIRQNLPRSAVLASDQPQPLAKDTIKKNLQRSLKWQYMREELTQAEVAYFEEQYSSYVQQFRDDVLPSEEDQIFNLLKLDIAVHRNRREVRIMLEEIEQLQDEYRSIVSSEEPADQERRREINQRLGDLRHAESERTAQYLKMSAELKSLQNDLKATRAQRFDKATASNKESFLDVLRKLQDPNYREMVGTAAEFASRATHKEEQRLAEWHRYENDTLDQPLLTSETVLDETPE